MALRNAHIGSGDRHKYRSSIEEAVQLKSLGWTNKRIAQAMGVHRNTVRNWFNKISSQERLSA